MCDASLWGFSFSFRWRYRRCRYSMVACLPTKGSRQQASLPIGTIPTCLVSFLGYLGYVSALCDGNEPGIPREETLVSALSIGFAPCLNNAIPRPCPPNKHHSPHPRPPCPSLVGPVLSLSPLLVYAAASLFSLVVVKEPPPVSEQLRITRYRYTESRSMPNVIHVICGMCAWHTNRPPSSRSDSDPHVNRHR